MNIRGIEINTVASKMVKYTYIYFKASDGWIWQFSKKRCAITVGLLKDLEPFRKNCVEWGHGAAWDFVTISCKHKNTVPL
jgi:hypothetical protein